ncbi:MAG: sporulation initiation factor Spo0A C-terminal domain-containing protein, partial [Prevotella sp.]
MNLLIAVSRALRQVGVPANLSGYRYLEEAVLLAYEDPDVLQEMTKQLYPKVAQTCNATMTRVERAIRYAIEYVYENTDPEALQVVFGNTYKAYSGKLTNTQFIAGMV